MAQVTITIPDTRVQDYVEAYAPGYNKQIKNPDYTEENNEPEFIDNPKTRAQVAKERLSQEMKSRVVKYLKSNEVSGIDVTAPSITAE